MSLLRGQKPPVFPGRRGRGPESFGQYFLGFGDFDESALQNDGVSQMIPQCFEKSANRVCKWGTLCYTLVLVE